MQDTQSEFENKLCYLVRLVLFFLDHTLPITKPATNVVIMPRMTIGIGDVDLDSSWSLVIVISTVLVVGLGVKVNAGSFTILV